MKRILSLFEKHIAIRYIMSGGLGAVANLSLLYALKEFLHIWYLLSGFIAFLCSLILSFALQKLWTFKDRESAALHAKFATFTAIAVINLAMNTVFLYLFTDLVGINYLISQVISSGLIAVWSFFIYRRFVFAPASASPPLPPL